MITARGVVWTELTVNKKQNVLTGKNQPQITSLKYNHLQVMRTKTGKFVQNQLKTITGAARQDKVYVWTNPLH